MNTLAIVIFETGNNEISLTGAGFAMILVVLVLAKWII